MARLHIFHKNVELFRWKNEKAAVLLPLLNVKHLKIIHEPDAEHNLIDTTQGVVYHDPAHPGEESRQWFSALDTNNVEVLFVYGIGIGHSYFPLKEWLSKDNNRRVVYVENDAAVLQMFLKTQRANLLLKDPQVTLYFIDPAQLDNSEGIDLLEEIAFGCATSVIHFVCSPCYDKYYKKLFNKVRNQLLQLHANIHIVVNEFLNCGVPFYRNFYRNLSLLPGSYSAQGLLGAFKNTPALIVGAGPSLNKQMALIQECAEQCLIFAGGSALNALAAQAIYPHFGAGIDPNPEQYVRLRASKGLGIPFFYRNRLLHEALALVSGPRIYVQGDDGYNTARWFERKLKIGGSAMDGGHSVSNFCLELAYLLGCRPIILVGMDLCYTDNQCYAAGIQDVLQEPDVSLHQESLCTKDIYGNSVRTEWKWKIEAEWIAEFHRKHPRLKIVNATEGGIGFDGIPNLSLKDVRQKFFNKPFDLMGKIHTVLEAAGELSCSLSDIDLVIKKLLDSLARSVTTLCCIIQYVEKHKRVKQGNTAHVLENPQVMMLYEKLKSEIAYKAILQTFDAMGSKWNVLKGRFLSHATERSSARKKRIVQSMEDHFKFLLQVSQVNQELILWSLNNSAMS